MNLQGALQKMYTGVASVMVKAGMVALVGKHEKMYEWGVTSMTKEAGTALHVGEI